MLKRFASKSNFNMKKPCSEARRYSDGALQTFDLYDDLPRDDYTLEYSEAGMFAAILEDAIWSLNILEQCNTEMELTSTLKDLPRLTALKFSVEQPPCTDELAGIDPYSLNDDQYKLMKLSNDRKLFLEALFPTYAGLAQSLTFKPLCEFNDRMTATENDIQTIARDQENNVAHARELRKKLRLQRNKQNATLYDCNSNIDRLNRLIEDSQLTEETKGRYVNNWQNARKEMHGHLLYGQDRMLEETIQRYKLQMNQETRVHAESELLVNIIIEETLQKVERWMAKYDKDIEAMDLRIQIQNNLYQKMMDRRIYLEQTFATHAKEIQSWVKFKDERAKANAYSENMTRSAIIVQAWWRGLLVRKELGPYRVQKKKGGKKKKEDK